MPTGAKNLTGIRRALDTGADDYLTKPFRQSSCWRACARCCAVTAPVPAAEDVVQVGDIEMGPCRPSYRPTATVPTGILALITSDPPS